MLSATAEMHTPAAEVIKQLSVVGAAELLVKIHGDIHSRIETDHNISLLQMVPVHRKLALVGEYGEPTVKKCLVGIGDRTQYPVNQLGLVVHLIEHLASHKQLGYIKRTLGIRMINVYVFLYFGIFLKYLRAHLTEGKHRAAKAAAKLGHSALRKLSYSILRQRSYARQSSRLARHNEHLRAEKRGNYSRTVVGAYTKGRGGA